MLKPKMILLGLGLDWLNEHSFNAPSSLKPFNHTSAPPSVMTSFAASMANMTAAAPQGKKKKKKKREASSSVDGNPSGPGTTSDSPASKRLKLQPPKVPPLVTFLGIGMQKAGTSWLYSMLSSHPSVALSREKEVHYWDMHKEDRDMGDEWYERQFPEDTEGKLVGEITPDYINMYATR